jgi:phosphate/sulfate permease
MTYSIWPGCTNEEAGVAEKTCISGLIIVSANRQKNVRQKNKDAIFLSNNFLSVWSGVAETMIKAHLSWVLTLPIAAVLPGGVTGLCYRLS